MNYNKNKYLEFYGKRLVYRYLVNLSFDIIEEYLKNTFEIENSEINNIHKTKKKD